MFILANAAAQMEHVSSDIINFAMYIVTKEEGVDFEDVAGDAGGATKCGISLRYARDQGLSFDLNHDGVVDEEDIRLITPEIACATFVVDFFVNKNFNVLAEPFQKVTFDESVNGGAGKSAHLVQRTINRLRDENKDFAALVFPPLVEDGGIGAMTCQASVHAAETFSRAKIINTYCDVRDEDYEAIVRANPNDAKFLHGWKVRSDSFRIPFGAG